MENNELYSEIEQLIIGWNIDGAKTAGALTREIMKALEKYLNHEFIICAAIRHEDTGKIFYGHRHNHCLEASNGELSWKLNREEISKIKRTQGFITNHNRFVERSEGLIIALANNQVLDKNEIRGNDLYSEDLY